MSALRAQNLPVAELLRRRGTSLAGSVSPSEQLSWVRRFCWYSS